MSLLLYSEVRGGRHRRSKGSASDRYNQILNSSHRDRVAVTRDHSGVSLHVGHERKSNANIEGPKLDIERAGLSPPGQRLSYKMHARL